MSRSSLDGIASALRTYGQFRGSELTLLQGLPGGKSNDVPSVVLQDTRFVFVDWKDPPASKARHAGLRHLIDKTLADDRSLEVLIVLINSAPDRQRVVLERGVSLIPLHAGIARLVGLPPTWLDSQMDILRRTLLPVTTDGGARIARLYLHRDETRLDASDYLSSYLGRWDRHGEAILFLRAEAGKGKSTVLAYASQQGLLGGKSPLPLYIPLRTLQRGRGISWVDLCASVGIIGPACEWLADGVRAGLVTPVLDGLDEVSGRYDPSVIQGVIDVVRDIKSQHSGIVISGRTTEASLLESGLARILSLELPEGADPAFREYASLVVAQIAPAWPSVATRVPEPPVPVDNLSTDEPTQSELDSIVSWLQLVFEDLGKEKSLFFVQSLACLGRSRQLDGNKPLIIRNPTGAWLARTDLFDTSVLAAALACIREQDKIEDIARELFKPAAQLELMTRYALIASCAAAGASGLPRANEAAQAAFGIDPVNQNEEFTAVLRQVQKHALLFAVAGDGVRAGDWQPRFLSDWVRCALLCRIALQQFAFCPEIDPEAAKRAFAEASRSRILFKVLLPGLVRSGRLSSLPEIWDALIDGTRRESPEACANYWALRSEPDATQSFAQLSDLQGLVPLADLSEMDFEGIVLDRSFAGTLAVLVGTSFSGCTLSGCYFQQCDFSGSRFSACVLSDVVFENCDGPLTFEGCSFENCRFENARARMLPAYVFESCSFDSKSSLLQEQPAAPSLFGDIAGFVDSSTSAAPRDLLCGACIGVAPAHVRGLTVTGSGPSTPPEVATLRSLLRLFFPRRAGSSGEVQVRGYIRSSALGRGVYPVGAPTAAELQAVLLGFGFTDGGRQGHVYAPWSSVLGGGANALDLRNELVSFLRNGTQGSRVAQMIQRVRARGSWKE